MGASKEEVESVLREIGTGRGNLEEEKPRHEVTLRPFLISKYEVSQAEWQKVMEENPSRFKGDSLPVERVSWNDCQDFCRKTGLSLPTEAQWEYACRARTTERYAGTGKLDDMGWYKANSAGRTHPVGEKEPNGFGLCDMHGNLWEWCEDFSQHDFYKESAGAKDPLSENSGSGNRVYRGGCFDNLAQFCRSAIRYGSTPSYRNHAVGFRPSRPLFR